MGQSHSAQSYENDLENVHQQHIDDPLIRIDLPNLTPIVGVEMKPVVHLKYVGGCVFEWRRMPKARRKLLTTNSSFRDNINAEELDSNEVISQSASPRGEREFSLTDLKPLNLPDPNRTVMHKIATSMDQNNIINSPNDNLSSSLSSLNSFRFLPNKERKGVLVCQGVNYTPQQTDVGHVLKFSVTFIGYKHSITSYVETQCTIPLPARTPARKWLMAEEELSKDSTNSSIYSIYDAAVSSKFSILSYNITGKNLLQLLRLKQTAKEVKDRQTTIELRDSSFNYPNCPDYVFTDVYRKKLLLREILSYNSDIICLQSMHEQLYNEWYMDLSKGGYSGVFKNTFANAPASDSDKKQSDGDLNYYDSGKLGSCILYRRGKFNKNKEWIVQLECDADVTSLLNKLALDHCITSEEKNNIIDQCRTNRNCGIIFELDFKDIYDIMQKLQKKSPTLDFNSMMLLFVSVNIYQQDIDDHQKQSLSPLERGIICLIQVHLIIRKIQTIMKDESYNQKGIRVGIVITGDFDSDIYSLAYEYLSKYSIHSSSSDNNAIIEDDEDERAASATPLEDSEGDHSPLLVNSNSQHSIATPKPPTETVDLNDVALSDIPIAIRDQILQHFVHDYKLNSAHRTVTGSEMRYKLSDRSQSLFEATELLFFNDDLKVLRVAEEPQNRTFPNIYFSSDHVALLAELDLDVTRLNGNSNKKAQQQRTYNSSSSNVNESSDNEQILANVTSDES